MLIRPVETGDAAQISSLLTLLDYPGTEAFINAKIEQQRRHPDAQLLVAIDGDKIAGFISLHFIPQIALQGDFCRVSYLCVDTSLRDQGIGTALLNHAEALALARGCDRMELHSHMRRENAHRFYQRSGYTELPKYLVKPLKQANAGKRD